MAKLTKEELIAKVNEKLADNSELAVELMEDITDSFEEVDLSGYVEKIIYDELLQRYKDRFLNPEEVKEIKEEEIVEKVELPKAENIGTNLGDLFKNIQL